MLSGTTTAARGPELLRGLIGLGCSTVIAIPTPNASRVIAPRDLADVAGVQVVVLFRSGDPATTSAGRGTVRALQLNSLNKLAHGIADSLALSVVAEAIGRRTLVILGPSLNQPLLDHPVAQASLSTLRSWHVAVVPPVDEGEGPRLAPSAQLFDAVRPYIRIG